MGAKAKNLRVTEAVDVPVKGAVFSLQPGDHAVTEHIADRVVAAGKGIRLIEKGKRLASREGRIHEHR